jgi:hypothetical protein
MDEFIVKMREKRIKLENEEKRLQNNIQKLPIEVQNIIISYTHQYQSPILLLDIRNFYTTYYLISKSYYNVMAWTEWPDTATFRMDQNWFINDLFMYFHQPDYYSKYNYGMYTIWKRRYLPDSLFSKNIRIRNFRKTFHKLSTNIQIRTLWGLMYPIERFQYIQYFDILYDFIPETDMRI